MLTYMQIKNVIDDSYDIEDVVIGCIIIPLFVFVDIIFIFFQPIFYLVYKKWK